MKNKISSVINMMIAIFLLIAINTFFSPCRGAMAMPCEYSTKTAEWVLVLFLILNIGKLFVEDAKGKLILNLTAIAAGIELLFVPKIGRCQIASMSCNTHTFPALSIGALLFIVLTAVFGAADFLENRREKHANHT